jgi:hypothetical protein
MYFGDWLRNSEVKNLFYLSVHTGNADFKKSLVEVLGRDSRISELHPSCFVIETLKSLKWVDKRLSRAIDEGEKAVLVFPVHKTVDHREIGFSSAWDEDGDDEQEAEE